MKLAKYRTAAGEHGVGSVVGDQLVPLALNEVYASLTDILEAEIPGQVAGDLRIAISKLGPPARPQTCVSYLHRRVAQQTSTRADAVVKGP